MTNKLICKLEGVEKEWEGKLVLNHVDLEVAEGQRVCLFGRNGVGKTTLLQGLMGRTQFDRGKVYRAQPLSEWGWLEQSLNVEPEVTILSFVQSASPDLHRLKLTLDSVQHTLERTAPEAIEEGLIARFTEAHEQYLTMNGYEWETCVEKCLTELRLEKSVWNVPYAAASGGQKTRAQLARLAVNAPKVIVLDEPTNHLDSITLEWLESWLRAYTGSVIFVSHDRMFIDNVADVTVELSSVGTKRYNGGYRAFKAQRELELKTQQTQYEKQERERKELLEAIRRYREWFQSAHNAASERNPFLKKKANKNMTRFRAKEKALERLESRKVEQPRSEPGLRMEFDAGAMEGNTLLTVEGVTFGYGERQIVRDMTLRLQRGDKLGVIGPNGVGKSTLLKLLTKQLLPKSGYVKAHPQLRIGYFAQELDELDPAQTILDTVLSVPDMTQSYARTILASFLFHQDDVFKRVGNLSMGEQCRVAFVKLYFSGANLLVLDEPTNYLDVDARERVEEWLEHYPGAVVVVSHDRYLMRNVANRVLSMNGQETVLFDGTLDEFTAREVEPVGERDEANLRRQLELQLTQLISQDQPETEEQAAQMLIDIRRIKQQILDLTRGIQQAGRNQNL